MGCPMQPVTQVVRRPFVRTGRLALGADRPPLSSDRPGGILARHLRAPSHPRLRSPSGDRVTFHRRGSCCPFESPNSLHGLHAMLDVYVVTYPGLPEPVKLYLNMYDEGMVAAPQGFVLEP